MPLITGADIDFALQDFSGTGSPNVTYGAQSCWGNLNRVPLDEALADGLNRIGTHTTLLIRDGALTGLVEDADITVDGSDFKIRDIGTTLRDGSRILTLVDA